MKIETALVDGRPLPLLVSEVIPPGFRHGFTTRAGGVSLPPYQELNFGRSWGDDPAHVLENRRRLCTRLGLDALLLVTQVHGAEVVRVRAEDRPEELAGRRADALVSDRPGAGLAVFVADCVPVLLADARTGACAAVHAGWRGVVGGAVGAAVRALASELGARAVDLAVALGPSIGPCCFEVGPEVVEAFRSLRPDGGDGVVLERPGRRPHVDLRRSLRLELESLGVAAGRIDADPPCTRCDPQGRFYSYRRDSTRTGQQLGVIAPAVSCP